MIRTILIMIITNFFGAYARLVTISNGQLHNYSVEEAKVLMEHGVLRILSSLGQHYS